jgi:hypothetical protein
VAVKDAVGVRVAVGVMELDAPRDSVAVGDAVCEGVAEGLCGPHGSAGTGAS